MVSIQVDGNLGVYGEHIVTSLGIFFERANTYFFRLNVNFLRF